MEYSPAQTPEEDFVNLVRLELDDIKHTFFKIGFRLREANNQRYFIKLGYESIEECAEALFGFKKTTTYDLMRLAEQFADRNAPMSIDPRYDGFNQSQLVLFSSINCSQNYFISMAKPSDTIATLKKAKSYWNKIRRGSITGFNGYSKLSIPEFIERVEELNPELTKTESKEEQKENYEQITFNENSGYPEKVTSKHETDVISKGKEDIIIEASTLDNQKTEISEWDKSLSDHLIKKCTNFLEHMSYKTIFDPDNKGMGVRVEKDLLAEQMVKEMLEAFNDNRTVIKTLFRNYLANRLGQYDYQIVLCGNKQGMTPFCGTVSTCIMDFFFDELTKIRPKNEKKRKKH